MLQVTLFLVSALALISRVAAHPASPLAVAVVIEQFKNAKIVPDNLPTFTPTGLLLLNYTGYINRTQVGVALEKTVVASAPIHVYIRGTAAAEATAGGPFNVTTAKYTVLTFDVGIPGAKPDQYTLHWLANNYTYGENEDHTVTLNASGTPVVAYGAPAPPPGSGPHRYVTLAYWQPDNFKIPTTPAVGSGVAPFNLTQYLADSGLSNPIAGTYFTVQDGTATVSLISTAAVISTTLPQYTPSSTSAATSSTARASGASSVGKSLHPETFIGAVSLFLGLFFA